MPGPARSGLSAGVGAVLTVTQTQAGAALVGASACVPPLLNWQRGRGQLPPSRPEADTVGVTGGGQ